MDERVSPERGMGVLTKLKRVAKGQDQTTNPYECRRCHAKFDLRYYSCPECGSYRVERSEWAVE